MKLPKPLFCCGHPESEHDDGGCTVGWRDPDPRVPCLCTHSVKNGRHGG